MFDSIFSAGVTPAQFFLMALAALIGGGMYAWLMSFRIRSSSRFFVVTALIPFAVASVISFVNGSIGAGVAIGGAFSLIRFRSAQGSADELAAILIAMAAGIAFGMGYLGYGIAILLCLAMLFILLAGSGLFEHKGMSDEQLLRITVPETLEYTGTFDAAFAEYLSDCSPIGVKTTGMGSMFRLSYKIRMKDTSRQKAFIDELRTMNGNLEIALLPYAHEQNQL